MANKLSVSNLLGIKYLNEDDIDIEVDGKVSLNDKMGLLTTVDDARKSLESIFKNNIDKPNNP